MSNVICVDGIEYEVCGDGCCILKSVTWHHDCIKVPSSVSTGEGERYQIAGISRSARINASFPRIISFESSSEITCVPLSFIGQCRSIFFLPPRTKRVLCSDQINSPKIILESSCQRFVSIAGSLVAMNNFPLELVYHHSRKHRFFIRETVRVVGDYSFFHNRTVTSIVFPSSVESIGESSFFECYSLRYVRFKKDSKLKIIGIRSFFFCIALESIDIPSSVEEIGDDAFFCCRNLRSVTFKEGCMLKKIEQFLSLTLLLNLLTSHQVLKRLDMTHSIIVKS